MTKPTRCPKRFCPFSFQSSWIPNLPSLTYIDTKSSHHNSLLSVIKALFKNMPPLHPIHIDSALRYQAMPILEHLAANEDARNRALDRLERDEPPPYVSSTESEEFEDRPRKPLPDTLPEELQESLDRPFDERKQHWIAHEVASSLDPYDRYHTEAELEHHLLHDYSNHKLFGLQHKYAQERSNIIVRHVIKRRWSKLGIWNPNWGIPGRLNERPEDNTNNWHWRWNREMIYGQKIEYKEHLARRALSLRKNLRRGEACPVQPRSNLQPDATASQAESFLISRPWFIWGLEREEEQQRRNRFIEDYIHDNERNRYQDLICNEAGKWWRERGDIKKRETAWFGPPQLFSWKWRHESPSPEPEDLTSLSKVQETPLEAVDIDFTPSEIDAFEEIPPPEKPWERKQKFKNIDPAVFLTPGSLFGPNPTLPNHDPWRYYVPPEWSDPLHPQGLSKPTELPDRSPSEELSPLPGSPEQQDETVLEQAKKLRPSPPKQGSWCQGQGRRRANPCPDETPRRSARIAALTTPTESYVGADTVMGRARQVASPITAPSKQGARGHPKMRAVPARPPPKEDAQPKRGRGRPRKMNGVSKPSPPTKMSTRRLAPGRAKTNFTAAGAYAAPRIAQASYKQGRQRRKRPEVLGNVRVSKSGRRRKPAAPQIELATIYDLRTTSQGSSGVAAVATRRGRALWRDKKQKAPQLAQLCLSGSRRPTRAGVNSLSMTQAYRTRSGRVSKPPARWIPR